MCREGLWTGPYSSENLGLWERKLPSPSCGGVFVERHSGEAKQEGPGSKVLKACQTAFVLVSPSAALGEKGMPSAGPAGLGLPN